MTNLQFYKTEEAARKAFMKRHAKGGSYCETCIIYNIAPNGGPEDCFKWWKTQQYVIPVKNACKLCLHKSLCNRQGRNVEQCEVRSTSILSSIVELPKLLYGTLKSAINTALIMLHK